MTTTSTITHDSATCQLGPDGGKCVMCKYADEQEKRDAMLQAIVRREPMTLLQQAMVDHDEDMARLDRSRYVTVEQSAAAIRDRRRALLERADTHSPTEGAMALAEAWLDGESWYQALPNNAMQDAEVLALAAVIEEAVGMRLRICQRGYGGDEQ